MKRRIGILLFAALMLISSCAYGFSDVGSGDWFYDNVTSMTDMDYLAGYEDGTFRPNRKISREEMCAILDRLLTALGKEIEPAELTFADAGEIDEWARESVARLVQTEIIRGQGNNRFAPKSTATRAEAAAVLHRLDTLLRQ
ncbi:MAG: S-layer homology domain-containing protein [Clostridia bacterium]|nr:S-layer homology domain-containing protein [Clostridia bacterium]